jgi:hypothetical protein
MIEIVAVLWCVGAFYGWGLSARWVRVPHIRMNGGLYLPPRRGSLLMVIALLAATNAIAWPVVVYWIYDQ